MGRINEFMVKKVFPKLGDVMKVTQKCALKVDLHLFWKKMDPLERKDSGTFLSSVSRRVFAL